MRPIYRISAPHLLLPRQSGSFIMCNETENPTAV